MDTAHDLMEALEQNYDALIKEGDWSVYVLPCLNPDGLYDGWTCNGAPLLRLGRPCIFPSCFWPLPPWAFLLCP